MQKITFEEVYSNEYIRQSIAVIVDRQTRAFPILATYADDIEQELWIHVSKALRRFSSDGSASLESYVRMVLDRRIHNVVKKYFSVSSINTFNADSIDSAEALAIYGKDEIALRNLRMDLKAVLTRLTPKQRLFCKWIMHGETFADIAERLKLSESSFYYLYIYPIREVFKSEKLEKYLNFH